MSTPIIPSFITVHLGAPDEAARNVRVPFIDYIKNVASGEIYPTWPENALRANIYTQVSFALNRVFTEWYPSRGYDFDITSSAQYDRKYVDGREIFRSVSQLADSLFNDYLVRWGTVQPLFTQYCSGTDSKCDGLSLWGMLDLARDGLTPYEILQFYFGQNISIVFNAPTEENLPSYPGIPLRLGAAGDDVQLLKRQLNRIGENYPSVRPCLEITDFYDANTEKAVKSFQRIFSLAQDGIVGKAAWYKIQSIFKAVKSLAELENEGLKLAEADRAYSRSLSPGDTGPQVKLLQYDLSLLSFFDDDLPMPSGSGTFDEKTEQSVRAFQAQQGLTVDGVVGRDTWTALTTACDRTVASVPSAYKDSADEIYPGRFLAPGQSGKEVRVLQGFLARAAENVPDVPAAEPTGVYDDATARAVRAIQALEGLPLNGVTGRLTWDAIVNLAKRVPS